MFGPQEREPLIYLLTASSPWDPSRRALVEHLGGGDWATLPTAASSWETELLALQSGPEEDYEDVRDDVFQDEQAGEPGLQSTLFLAEEESRDNRSTMSLRGRKKSRSGFLGGGGRRKGGGRTQSSLSLAGGSRSRGLLGPPRATSSMALASSLARQHSTENLYEASPVSGLRPSVEDILPVEEEESQVSRSGTLVSRREGSRGRARSRERGGGLFGARGRAGSKESDRGSRVELGGSRRGSGLFAARSGSRGRVRSGSRGRARSPERTETEEQSRGRGGVFRARSGSRGRAGSVEGSRQELGQEDRSQGGARGRKGLFGGRSRSRGRAGVTQSRSNLVQSTASIAQSTVELQQNREVAGQGGGVTQGRRGGGARGRGPVMGGRARSRAKSSSHIEQEQSEEGGKRTSRTRSRNRSNMNLTKTSSLPRRKEPLRRSQSSWSIR